VRRRDRHPRQQRAEGDDGGRGGTCRRGGDGPNPRAFRPAYAAPASAGRSGGVTPREGDVMRITKPAAIRHSSPAPMKAP